jgi:hypothetical protein
MHCSKEEEPDCPCSLMAPSTCECACRQKINIICFPSITQKIAVASTPLVSTFNLSITHQLHGNQFITASLQPISTDTDEEEAKAPMQASILRSSLPSETIQKSQHCS